MKMKNLKTLVGIMAIIMVAVLSGCGSKASKTKTFAEWSEVALFQDVPAMVVEGAQISDEGDCGAGNYLIKVEGTKKSDYEAYLKTLEEAGFEKYVDNGEGLDGAVFNTIFKKGDVVLTVVHMDKSQQTHITVGEGQSLSKHLFYDDSYVANNIEGAQTKLHMVELYYFGSSFIIQLKDGHFIINDGGTEYDTPYLFDYLEELAPTGTKPVVDAWIVSHAHYDHIRVIDPIIKDNSYADRIYVEGFYFNEPGEEVNSIENVTTDILNLEGIRSILKTTEGGQPEMYRMHTGERYYFNDITMDVVLTQEQIPLETYEDGYNETSTWVMFTMEGQTTLITGDAGPAGMAQVMANYSQDYLTMNIFSAAHHGHNTRGDFTKYCTVKDVVLYSERNFAGGGANTALREQAAESFIYGDGTKILTFPYTTGTVQSLPCNTWKYHAGQTRPSL